MNTNYSAKLSIATPFITALVGLASALSSHAGIIACAASALGGFIVGLLCGALSGGFTAVLLSRADHCSKPLYMLGLAILYFILPIAFLAAACMSTFLALRFAL